jgi:hypothetical protein
MNPVRIISVVLLCTWIAGISVSHAQDVPSGTPATLPEWVVLVLKPISASRVRPVTGVVVSADGLILVPESFAAPGDQIIVLDGGTDIITDGRAATVSMQLPGLTLISAPGLNRQAANFSSQPMLLEQVVHLAAFPPAEQISQGEAPLWLPAKATDMAVLPNVSGPLIDDCGSLAGFSSADGLQSMDTTTNPAYLWKNDLRQALSLAAVVLQEKDCSTADVAATNQAEEESVPELIESAAEDPDAEGLPEPVESKGVDEDSEDGNLAGVGLLAAIVLSGLFWFGYHRKKKVSESHDIKPTTSLLTSGESMRSAASLSQTASPDLLDGFIEVSGRLANGSPFQSTCKVNEAAIDVIIGRGDVDIRIDSQAVHREHARLSGSAENLTITDLGSASGTWINRVPCLKGEIMFVESEDTVFMGDVSMHFEVKSAETDRTSSRDDS